MNESLLPPVQILEEKCLLARKIFEISDEINDILSGDEFEMDRIESLLEERETLISEIDELDEKLKTTDVSKLAESQKSISRIKNIFMETDKLEKENMDLLQTHMERHKKDIKRLNEIKKGNKGYMKQYGSAEGVFIDKNT
jgi:chromosome segregation ATPase